MTVMAPERRRRRGRHSTAVGAALERCPELISAQALYARMVAEGHRISLTTVYRRLHELERAGRVDVVRDEGGERLFSAREDGRHHHYLVCRLCSRSEVVDADPVEEWSERIGPATGFADVEHTLELRGTCADCLDGERRPSRV